MLDFLSRLFVRMVDSLCWISAIGKCVYALMPSDRVDQNCIRAPQENGATESQEVGAE